tara:strand:- start:94 stop:345 length:252 start_codon:yes stop_codon:yes gene_type:complete
MLQFDKTLSTAILIYLLSCYILYNLKHEKMFDEKGNFKNFGLNKQETIFPFWLVTTIIGLFSYYLLIINEKNIYDFNTKLLND